MAEKLAPEKRHSFVREDKTVFEWDQTLEEVNIYINLPPNVHSKQFYCKIQSKHAFISMSRNPDDLLNSSQPGLKQEELTAAMLRNTWIRWEGIN